MRLSTLYRRTMATVDLASLRIKYKEKRDIFHEDSLTVKNPFHIFKTWLDEAVNTPEILEPNAMCLATATKNGIPSARYVLLKGCTSDGFTLFTNYGSRKAKELAENPCAALTFYWMPLRRSIRIEGDVEKVSAAESEEYFHQRPKASQIGALASPQSQLIPNRNHLDKIEEEIKSKLNPDEPIPMPDWGGYLVKPKSIEFWQGQTNRLHDRIRFRKPESSEIIDETLVHAGDDGWVYERLAP